MRWALVGGTGSLGRELAPLLDDPIVLGSKDLDLLGSPEDWPGLEPGCGIVNLAAMTNVSACERDPKTAMLLNGVVPARLYWWYRVRLFVQVSTDYVFGALPGPFRPGDPHCPTNVYGESKARAEVELARASVEAYRVFVARMSFLPRDPGYEYVFDEVHCTKEWVDDAAQRLARYLRYAERASGSPWILAKGHGFQVDHVVPERSTTLEMLVHERYPDLPTFPVRHSKEAVGYRYPEDVRLAEAWNPDVWGV